VPDVVTTDARSGRRGGLAERQFEGQFGDRAEWAITKWLKKVVGRDGVEPPVKFRV